MVEADFSNKHLGVGGAIIISSWLTNKDNGALTSLDISSNSLGQLSIPDGWEGSTNGYQFKNSSGKWLGRADVLAAGAKAEGLIALTNAIPGMGALTSLNIANNELFDESAHIAEAVKVSNCVVAGILVQFVCPSGHCCLLLSPRI
jgi:hypothetical protein